MVKYNIDNELLAKMYLEGTGLKGIENYFSLSNQAIYACLKKMGIDANRKVSNPWTSAEDEQLIALREAYFTGEELFEQMPNRSKHGIKSRLQKLRNRRMID